jgi:hypothetical protein
MSSSGRSQLLESCDEGRYHSVQYKQSGSYTTRAVTSVVLETLFCQAVYTAMDNPRAAGQWSARYSPGDLGFRSQYTLGSSTCISLKMRR